MMLLDPDLVNAPVASRELTPCHVFMSSKVPGFNMENVMPYWWSTAQWHFQFPQETVVNTNVTMSSIKARGHPNHDAHYCPDWSAPNILGAPRKGK